MEADKVKIKINIIVHGVPEKTEGCEIIVLKLKPLSIDSVTGLVFSNPKGFTFKFPDKLYLRLQFLRKLPVVGFKVVQLIKLIADVFYRELKQIPEPCQVLCCWSWVGVDVLQKCGHRQHLDD